MLGKAKNSAVLQLSFHNGIFFFMARLTNNFFFASIFYARKLAKVDNCKKHEYLFAGLIRNDSEVATMTVKLWSKMFTGKSSTVLQLSFHDGISFLSPN